MKRRKFIGLLAGAGACLAASPATAGGTHHFEGYPDSHGVLFDSTKCIGCRKCEAACNKVNELPAQPVPFDDLTVLETKRRTHHDTFTVVNKYDVNGKPVFRKIQCNHCLEPACASACFVGAFVKDKTGAVSYDAKKCVGCRYCMVACPFEIPTYEYHDPVTPRVRKCTMCQPRIEEGKVPGCVEDCPKGALVFGKREDLLDIARERIRKHPDQYIDHIYGEREMGGTSWLYISGASFESIGMREDLGVTPAPELTSGALSVVPAIVGLWPMFLTGAYALTKRKEKVSEEEREHAVKEAVAETEAEAAKKLKAAMDKAERDKQAAIDREVKKALKDAEEARKKAESADSDEQ
ncbi:MAG: 4Fe-4S dicluster domain-containing protein [Desulfomicrobium sp.]|nr:4Fe-4S dicluster domain-containing protein [Desulfomicrobium sp.]